MDAKQLRELAFNATTGHWPPHLGVNSDQEKIAYLASQLEAAANEDIDTSAEIDHLEGQLEDAQAESANLEKQNDMLRAEIEKVKGEKK